MAPARAVSLNPLDPSASPRAGTFVRGRLRRTRPSGIISPRHPSHDTTVLPPSTGAAPEEHRTSVGYEQFYEEHRALIDRTVARICRRNLLTGADADDFAQEARMKLLEAGVFDRFKKRSSLQRYLNVVLQNAYRDIRNKEWGKWRPSVEAQRNGPVAVKLEQLMVRDGLSFDEALETLRTNHRVTLARAKLEGLAARLPIRVNRRPLSDDVLITVPDGLPAPDVVLSRGEHQAYVADVNRVLREVLGELDSDDRLLIKLRYIDGLKIVHIALLLKTDPKQLYRRIERLLEKLRVALEATGIDSKRLFDDEEPWG